MTIHWEGIFKYLIDTLSAAQEANVQKDQEHCRQIVIKMLEQELLSDEDSNFMIRFQSTSEGKYFIGSVIKKYREAEECRKAAERRKKEFESLPHEEQERRLKEQERRRLDVLEQQLQEARAQYSIDKERFKKALERNIAPKKSKSRCHSCKALGKVTCKMCDGRGRYPSRSGADRSCEVCSGTGWTDCRECGGKRYV